MRKKTAVAVGIAAIAAALAVAGTLGGRATPASAAAKDLASCTNVKLGVLAPLTGPAGFLGGEQLSWVQFAVSKFNKQYGTKFGVVEGDTQLSADLSRRVARRIVSNTSIVGVVGGSTNQSVISSGDLFKTAKLVSVSSSATRISLTNGQFPTFFRVVPHDGIQAPDIVRYVTAKLKAKKVTIVDSQDDYSVPLADAIESSLERKKVTVDRQSVANTVTDFSTIATNVDADTNLVIFATQAPPLANTLAQQLLEQGKRAVLFGTDGAYSPAQFKPRHGYVSVFWKDLRFYAPAKKLVAEYKVFSKNRPFGSFGGPSYQAAWVMMDAARKACADDKLTRAELVPLVAKTNLPSIQGGRVRFSSKGDPLPTKFYIYEVTKGVYRNVG